MTAAALTPSVVQFTSLYATGLTGTPVRLKKYFAVVTKVTTSDWVVAETYFPGTFVSARAYTIDSSGDGVEDITTYTATGTKVVLTHANVGTTYMEVTVQPTS
jgi:hypothetical protein